MIDVTWEAAEVLREALEESGVDPQRGLRLYLQDSQWKLGLDEPRERDRVIRHGESVVVIVAPMVEAAAGTAVIDIKGQGGNLDLVLLRKGD